jgi:hypothetical protein
VSLETARTALGADTFMRAWKRGVEMTLEEAIVFASETTDVV